MIKTIMRKTLYKETSNEEFEFLWKLTVKRSFLQMICLFSLPLMFMMTFVPVLILDACEPGEFSIFSQTMVCIFITFYAAVFFLLLIKCKRAVTAFSMALAQKLHFVLSTVRGKALTKEDFKTIKKEKDSLFMAISTGLCQGYCYSVSFELLKVLKEGHMEFWAIQCFGKEENDDKPYTMHAIYVKDGWAFDTFSARQYKVDELAEIYKAKKYKTFAFQEIESVSYDDFRKIEKDSLHEWCSRNDCYVSFAKDLD